MREIDLQYNPPSRRACPASSLPPSSNSTHLPYNNLSHCAGRDTLCGIFNRPRVCAACRRILALTPPLFLFPFPFPSLSTIMSSHDRDDSSSHWHSRFEHDRDRRSRYSSRQGVHDTKPYSRDRHRRSRSPPARYERGQERGGERGGAVHRRQHAVREEGSGRERKYAPDRTGPNFRGQGGGGGATGVVNGV